MFGTLRLYPYTAGVAAVDAIANKLNGKTVPEVVNFFETAAELHLRGDPHRVPRLRG